MVNSAITSALFNDMQSFLTRHWYKVPGNKPATFIDDALVLPILVHALAVLPKRYATEKVVLALLTAAGTQFKVAPLFVIFVAVNAVGTEQGVVNNSVLLGKLLPVPQFVVTRN